MPLRWGIIGCGDVVRRRVADAIRQDPGSELVAACRRNKDKLAEFCRDYQVGQAYATAEALIADPQVDAVYVATPVCFHCEQTILAAQSGKHVLVEKPMAMSTAECDRMIAVCRDHDRTLGVAYYRRFYPVIDRIKELIRAGEIGRPRAIGAVTCNAFTMSPDDDGYWRVREAEGGGGALMDIGSHRLNLFLDILGPVADVHGYCDHLGQDYPVDNTSSLNLRFENGCHGHLQCYFGVSPDPDEFTVTGEKGKLVVAPLNRGQLRIHTGSSVREESHPADRNFSRPLIADFVAAVAANQAPRVGGEEGRAANHIMELAYQAGQR